MLAVAAREVSLVEVLHRGAHEGLRDKPLNALEDLGHVFAEHELAARLQQFEDVVLKDLDPLPVQPLFVMLERVEVIG